MDDFFAAMRLSALLDGDLEGEEKALVEQAIRQSPRLRVQYSRMMTAVELVRSQGDMTAPDNLEQKILDRLRADGMMGTTWADRAPSRRTMTATAAVFASMGLIWAQWPEPVPISDALLPEETKTVAKVPKKEKVRMPAPAPAIDVRRPAEKKQKITKASPPPKPKPKPKATTRRKPSSTRRVITEVPLWEDEYRDPPTDLPEPAELAPQPAEYRLYPANPDALKVLNGWVSHAGGSMDCGPRGLRDFNNEDNYAVARISLPGSAVTTLIDFMNGLGPLNNVVPIPDEASLQESVSLKIELQYKP